MVTFKVESGSEIGYNARGNEEILKPSMSLILNRPDGNVVLVPGWQKPLFHSRVQQDTEYGSLTNMLWIHQHFAKTRCFGWIFKKFLFITGNNNNFQTGGET